MYQPNFNQLPSSDKRRRIGAFFLVVLASGFLYGSYRLGSSSYDIEVADVGAPNAWNKIANLFTISAERKVTIDEDPDYNMPKPEESRLDILILGVRGEDDEFAEEGGALLTDTIMLLSYDKDTGRTSLVSIPRDLYIRIYDDKKDKINSVYEVGVLRDSGIRFAKKIFSRITGVYIDNVIVISFSSFRGIIDSLGGIDVELAKPFMESGQWGYEFYLPAGNNYLDGETALYYARSRFSTSDFDRAQRQQKIIMAVKEKIVSLSILSDPIRTISVLNSLRNNIKTDLKLWDINDVLALSKKFEGSRENVKNYVITTGNLVYESHIQTDIGNLYILLPKGDNLEGIKQLFQDILD